MASLRAARLLPRARFALPSRIIPTQRMYATVREATDSKPVVAAEQASEDMAGQGDDPNMNGNYPDPNLTSALPVKRQFRDPYADWWDKQERRNYGEPVHEDNDILGIFSPHFYDHVTPGWGAVQFGSFLVALGVVLGVVYRYYPDKPSVPRAFPGGLESELGGPEAVTARKSSEDTSPL